MKNLCLIFIVLPTYLFAQTKGIRFAHDLSWEAGKG